MSFTFQFVFLIVGCLLVTIFLLALGWVLFSTKGRIMLAISEQKKMEKVLEKLAKEKEAMEKLENEKKQKEEAERQRENQ